MRVEMMLTFEVDADTWATEYGLDVADAPADFSSHLTANAREIPAALKAGWRALDIVQITATPRDEAITELISREQAEAWAGRTLTDELWNRLTECVPLSSVPEAIGTIIDSMDDNDDEEDA
jgi:hypothetical protein